MRVNEENFRSVESEDIVQSEAADWVGRVVANALGEHNSDEEAHEGIRNLVRDTQAFYVGVKESVEGVATAAKEAAKNADTSAANAKASEENALAAQRAAEKAMDFAADAAGSIVVDDAMSDTSENAVQNKVIKAYIDEKSSEPFIIKFELLENEICESDKTCTEVAEAINANRSILVQILSSSGYTYFLSCIRQEVYINELTGDTEITLRVFDPGSREIIHFYCSSFDGTWNWITLYSVPTNYIVDTKIKSALADTYTKAEVDDKFDNIQISGGIDEGTAPFIIKFELLENGVGESDKTCAEVAEAINANRSILVQMLPHQKYCLSCIYQEVHINELDDSDVGVTLGVFDPDSREIKYFDCNSFVNVWNCYVLHTIDSDVIIDEKINDKVGDIEAALDGIVALQENYIGGAE